ncbi:hypothetical protein KY290_010270 [Solanum tuberosum]|uniref:Uncharacterized protein n=1 Tax=Solanum tuberosum TaxID=4113 RepID=A0ABQ7VXB0_SOLTU|nr:hypothetical protein KY289_010657 [Solanum tuberosum]KAH0773133.1 hypothetical protein KY290_010270 [Solanum tuberosum]
MIYWDRTGTGPDRNGTGMNGTGIPVPNHGTVPFRVPVQCIPSRPEYCRTGTNRNGTGTDRNGTGTTRSGAQP